MIDFVLFFEPDKKFLKLMGYKGYFLFGNEGDGIILKDPSQRFFRNFFQKNYRKYLFFGVIHEDEKALYKIVREGLPDFVVNPPIKYNILKEMKENKISIVFDVSRVSKNNLYYYKRLFEIGKRMRINMIFSSFSKCEDDIIPALAVRSFIEMLGERFENTRKYLYDNIMRILSYAEIRKKSFLPGVYLEEVSEE